MLLSLVFGLGDAVRFAAVLVVVVVVVGVGVVALVDNAVIAGADKLLFKLFEIDDVDV